MSNMLSGYFEEVLRREGFDPVELKYSLGYCQGDHVEFRASRWNTEALTLAKKVLSVEDADTLASYCQMTDDEVDIYVHHPDHNRVYVELGTGMSSIDEDNLEDQVAWVLYQQVEGRILNELQEALTEHVDGLCHRLLQDGYKLLEAGRPSWYLRRQQHEIVEERYGEEYVVLKRHRVGRLLVEVRMWSADTDDMFDPYESGERDADHASVLKLIEGTLVYGNLQVVVFDGPEDADADDCDELACEWCHGVMDTPDLVYCTHGLAAELVGEAVATIRANRKRLQHS